MSLANIKNNIKTHLDDLVTDTVLAGATITDIKKDPLSMDIARFPHAFLMPPSIESVVEDNRGVVRTYTFSIMVAWNAENLASDTEVETAIEAILTEFDNDPTLGGYANGGVLPVSSSPMPIQHGGKDLVVAFIELQAKAYVSLTF